MKKLKADLHMITKRLIVGETLSRDDPIDQVLIDKLKELKEMSEK